jgi:hypothetical protein
MTYTPEQIQEHRREWLDALRSGKYNQTTGFLAVVQGNGRQSVGHCCLGVACEVYGLVPDAFENDGARVVKMWGGTSSYLPREVMDWLGVTMSDPMAEGPYGRTSASSLNDGGKTFAEIADLFEREWFGEVAA